MISPTDNIEFTEIDLSRKSKGYEVAYIYYLYHNDILLYIGQAVNALIRVPHHTDKKFNRAKYFQIPYSEKDYTEIAHIQHYNPFYNGTHADVQKQVKFIEINTGYYFNKRFYPKGVVYLSTTEYIVLKPSTEKYHYGDYSYYDKITNKLHSATVGSGEGELYWDALKHK